MKPNTLLDGSIRSLLSALATFEGLKISIALVDGVNQVDSLIRVGIALLVLNIIAWKSSDIKYAALREWVEGIYEPFSTFIMYIIVRISDDFVFNDAGSALVRSLAAPIIIVFILVGLRVVIKRRLKLLFYSQTIDFRRTLRMFESVAAALRLVSRRTHKRRSKTPGLSTQSSGTAAQSFRWTDVRRTAI